jgi:TPR repeat protein
MYDGVTGVAQYKVKAAQLFQRACDLGNAAGCNNLGVLYDKGIGVAQDKVKAAQLFRKACDGGIAQGCQQTPPPQKH